MFVFTVYCITNKINKNFYIGIHKTTKDNLFDYSYMGSGDNIIRAIKNYGKENFVKCIIASFNSLDEAKFLENKLVDENFVSRRDTYNKTVGGGYPPTGSGDKNNFFGKKHTEESKELMRIANSGENHPMFGREITDSHRENLSKSKQGEKHPMFGKNHTEESKNKISNSTKGEKSFMFGKNLSQETKNKISEYHLGLKASEESKAKMSLEQTGKIPHNNGLIEIKVLLSEVPEGFVRGRLKFKCPYCETECDRTNLVRWHGDKCKFKEI